MNLLGYSHQIFPVILSQSFWNSFLFLAMGAAEGGLGKEGLQEHQTPQNVCSIAAAV